MSVFDTSLLEYLVNINTQSQNIPGVTQAQKFLASELNALGMEINWHPNLQTNSADCLVATIGEGPVTVTLLGHVDTVAKGGDFFPFQRSSEGLLFGAGIADMKGGVAMIVEILKKSLPSLNSDLRFQVVISPNEEVGSPGFHGLFKELGRESDLVLCFEPALEDGSFIGGRNGNRWYDFHFKGEKLHTGRAPKGSLNILHQLCELQQVLNEHVDDDDATKFNFTSFSTDNEKFNVTSSFANAKMDLRFSNEESRESFHQKILHWRKEKKIPISYDISDDCPPMANVSGESLVLELQDKLSKAERLELSCRHCEGASDANYFSHEKNIVLDGLGPRGNFFHSRKEFLFEESLANRTMGLVHFLQNLCLKDSLSERATHNLFAEAQIG